MSKSKIEKFIDGELPVCKKNPSGIHVKVQGMGVKKPYCLWCKKTSVEFFKE